MHMRAPPGGGGGGEQERGRSPEMGNNGSRHNIPDHDGACDLCLTSLTALGTSHRGARCAAWCAHGAGARAWRLRAGSG